MCLFLNLAFLLNLVVKSKKPGFLFFKLKRENFPKKLKKQNFSSSKTEKPVKNPKKQFFENYDIHPAPKSQPLEPHAAAQTPTRELQFNTKHLLNIERAIQKQRQRQRDAARESPGASPAQATRESVSRFAPFIEKSDFEGQIVLVDAKVIYFLQERDGLLALCERNFYFFEGFYSEGKTVNYRLARSEERFAAVKRAVGGGRELLAFFKRSVTDLRRRSAGASTPEFRKLFFIFRKKSGQTHSKVEKIHKVAKI